MKKKLIALVLLAGSSAFAESRFSIGVGIGAPVVASRPFYPGPGYTWVDGYYDPYGSWIDGYWAPPVAAFGFASRYRNPFDYGFRRDFDRRDFDRRDFDRRDFDRDRRRDFGRAREFDRDHDGDRSRATGFGFRR
jgi:hypothetical protein